MFTLTIYFIALNVYVEFVLIYRPHPVCSLAVNMNNTEESFFFTVGVLKLLTFSLHKMLRM